jgi:hypothetical protein
MTQYLEMTAAGSEGDNEGEEGEVGQKEGKGRGESDVMHDDMKIMYPKRVCSNCHV